MSLYYNNFMQHHPIYVVPLDVAYGITYLLCFTNTMEMIMIDPKMIKSRIIPTDTAAPSIALLESTYVGIRKSCEELYII